MPTWLTVAIWIIIICWTFIEITAFMGFNKENNKRRYLGRPLARYSAMGSFFSIMWFILMTMWVCFQVFG